MNIKSLLLGSAAAMVAVSGAQAADAIVVEPEPVEYVRVCDAYGSGFFYIPGTETCLNFNGYVRVHYVKSDEDDFDGSATTDTEDTLWNVRARFNIDARNETDWGTLRSQIRFQGSSNNGDGIQTAPVTVTPTTGTAFTHAHGVLNGVELDRALISIGGFRAGLSDNYWTTNHGYSGVNAAGLGILVSDDGAYGFSNNIFMDYTYAVDGLAITVGVEDRDENVSNSGAGSNGEGSMYAGINYRGDGYTFAFTWANYDASVATSKGDAYKVSLTLDLSEFIPGGSLYGMYRWEDMDTATPGVAQGTVYVGSDNDWRIGFNMDLSDDMDLWALYQDTSEVGHISTIDADLWAVGINWYPVSGLKLLASYTAAETTNSATNASVEVDQFVIGIRRSF